MWKAKPIACPTCGAEYEVVRVEAPPTSDEKHLTLHKLRWTIARS